jgi:hypothetical protein
MSGFRWRRGHTLLQLAATMAILALLVLAAMPAYRESRMRGYLAEARQIAREWAHLARAWYLEKGSWQGATDQAIGWVNPNSRFWIYGPHRYGPEGFPNESWFVARLRPGLATGFAWAQDNQPEYLFIIQPSGATAECGTLTHRDCQGRNLAGGPPPQNPPGNLRVLAKTHNSISVAWDDTLTETSYTVRWRKSSSGSWDGQAPLAQDTTSYTISGLQPETEYLIQVEATGPGGTAAAGPISVTTDGVAPPAATNLQVTATTDTSISISWQDNAANETGYRVEHRQQGASSWVRGPNLPANTTSHTVTGLQPETTYELRVVAFNSWGSTPSAQVTAQTQGSPPAAPTNLRLVSATSNSMVVAWDDNATNETGYRVRLKTQSGSVIETSPLYPANTTQATLPCCTGPLSPETTYTVEVWAERGSMQSAVASEQFTTDAFFDDFSSNPSWIGSPFAWDSSAQNVYVAESTNELTGPRALPVGSRSQGYVEAKVSIPGFGSTPPLLRGGVAMRKVGTDGIHLVLSTRGCDPTLTHLSLRLWTFQNGYDHSLFCHTITLGFPAGPWTLSHVIGLSVSNSGTVKVFLDGTLLTSMSVTLPTGTTVAIVAWRNTFYSYTPRLDDVRFSSTPR